MSFNAYVDPLSWFPSDLPGVNLATKDRMLLYYCLMTKVDGLLVIVRYFPGRVVTAGIRAITCTRV
jgi:hypothetical protein